MKEELGAIERNKTWELIELPRNKKVISVIWVYKVKLKPDGSISKHKARSLARAFLQKSRLDYFEVFDHEAYVSQAPRVWNLKIDLFFKLQGFIKCKMDYGFYVQHTSDNNMILLKYELEILKRFELMNCKSAITPTETNHKLDFDVEGDYVDCITFKQLLE
ncbi:uncharacterized mitochondrial protein AtMg00820-like [Lathyrus oleraceus]|uniref:uncharacterized mitochondrial protein AtMg00820-like n=1 Tax=Pisum sativum TaxID=3888 RepID=UPI0021CFC468|nr:uncharacterized mitochondrial protein AtMg00820-like [Pisum sativum]